MESFLDAFCGCLHVFSIAVGLSFHWLFETPLVRESLFGGMERWNRTVEWNSGTTTPTSRGMTNTRNDLHLSTEDRTVQRAFELVLARQV